MKQCREHNCPLQDICRGAVDNETWWNIGDDCEIFAFVNAQADKIFALESRLKECENGYEGTLHLESNKLHDAEEKVKELTQANEQLSESYDHLEKTKDELLAERSRLIEKCQEAEKINKEKCKLEYTLLGVMHSVDKWLEGEELEQDEVKRAITMREKTLQIVEKLTAENERLKNSITFQVVMPDDKIEEIKAECLERVELDVKECRADTVRKMYEKLKEKYTNHSWGGFYVPDYMIDQIAKEMLEGE